MSEGEGRCSLGVIQGVGSGHGGVGGLSGVERDVSAAVGVMH